VLPGAKGVVDDCLGQVGRRGRPLDRQAPEAAGIEQAESAVEQLLTALLARTARRVLALGYMGH